MDNSKQQVHDFWNEASCGEELYLTNTDIEGYQNELKIRYKLEPYILTFADFSSWRDKRVLEIGVGLGSDHQKFAEAGAKLWGIDLTEQAIQHTSQRLKLLNLDSDLRAADAEALPFPDNHFDLVYSWGVIHHSPDTQKAAREILRVLRPGGQFKVMVYNKYSMIGLMLWLRYGLIVGRPIKTLAGIYAEHLESPGTKAYTKKEAAELFVESEELKIEIVLSHGDLLEGEAGQRHKGIALSLARAVWPRRLIKLLFPHAGLFMMISGKKVSSA